MIDSACLDIDFQSDVRREAAIACLASQFGQSDVDSVNAHQNITACLDAGVDLPSTAVFIVLMLLMALIMSKSWSLRQ